MACVRKHIQSKLDWEDTLQLPLFSFRMLPGIHSKESPVFFHLIRDPLNPLKKTPVDYDQIPR